MKIKNNYTDSVDQLQFSKDFEKNTLTAMKKAAQKTKRKWIVAAAAVFVAVCIGATSILLSSPTDIPEKPTPEVVVPDQPAESVPADSIAPVQNLSVLLLSINPQIEFTVDESDMIISVIGKNEDGAALIEGIDFTGYSFQNAAIIVVNKLIENNYISVLDVEKTITLSLSGENRRENLMEEMSAILSAAAQSYELNVEVQNTTENELQILLAQNQEEVVDENALPEADPEEMPEYMKVVFELTGKINRPEDIGWDPENPGVFRAGYTEVADVWLTIENGKKYRASEIVEFDTAGEWLTTSVFQVMNSLIKKGYITDDMPGTVSMEMPGCTDQKYQETMRLAGLMLQEAGVNSVSVSSGPKEDAFILTPLVKASQQIPADVPVTPAKYTMEELLNDKINKNMEDITELQMEILSLAYTYDGAVEKLKARRWAVVPDVMGMDGDEAVALLREAGFEPSVVMEYLEWFEYDGPERVEFAKANIGKVIYQDAPPGMATDVAWHFQINIVTDEPEPVMGM